MGSFVQWIDLVSKNPLQLAHSAYKDTKIFGTKVWGGSLDFNFYPVSMSYWAPTSKLQKIESGNYERMIIPTGTSESKSHDMFRSYPGVKWELQDGNHIIFSANLLIIIRRNGSCSPSQLFCCSLVSKHLGITHFQTAPSMRITLFYYLMSTPNEARAFSGQLWINGFTVILWKF